MNPSVKTEQCFEKSKLTQIFSLLARFETSLFLCIPVPNRVRCSLSTIYQPCMPLTTLRPNPRQSRAHR